MNSLSNTVFKPKLYLSGHSKPKPIINHLCKVSVRCKSLSCVLLFGTVAHQSLLSMGFSRQEYWSRLPCPSLGDLPNPGTEPRSPALEADSLLSEPPGKSMYAKVVPKEGTKS